MVIEGFKSANPFGFSDDEKWHLDEIIMDYWNANNENEKKRIELECYKHFKWMGFKYSYIDYLKKNDCEELAEEMNHFVNVFKKVSHEHEKSLDLSC